MPLPTDPLLAQQWHLHNATPGLLDLNVFGVWNPTEGAAYTGAGTRTVVIDDGFDYLHQDLVANYDQGLDYDFVTNGLDPFGASSDSHGTAVTGIIGAAANGTGAVGVAYGTQLVGYRTYGFISDAWLQDIRDSIHDAAVSALADVANISQGIANDPDSEFGFGYDAVRFDEIETSIGDAVGLGRGGLGMTIVKSAGNSRYDSYDANSDDWTNDTRQVVVAAVDQDGFVSSYSTYGAALLVSGFGTPGQVVTTDRTGAAGNTGTDFTSIFNGTSAAAPMVTGVVSLMYDANSGLGWRDVQSILGVSARHVGSAVGGALAGAEQFGWGFNAANTWNGGGQHFSNDYGYGLVDALAAVRLAETWLLGGAVAETNANEFTNTVDVLNSPTVITDGNTTGLSFSGTASFDDTVERVTVQMTFSTTFLADMEVYLTSPDGTVSRLIADQAGGADFNGTWTFESQAFRGERAGGTWTVRVVDDAGGDALTVSDIVIKTYGSYTSNDRYVFTNEYSDYAGLFGHVTAINDTNGGTDTANAAAVTTESNIRLDGTQGLVDGIVVTFAGIENAIGGDGNDSIVGSLVANQLFGMRGGDQLSGGNANDVLDGGTGNDYLDGGAGADTMYGGVGIDTLDYSSSASAVQIYLFNGFAGGDAAGDSYSGFENATGGAGNDFLAGDALANTLSGNFGNDTLQSGGGNDSLLGGDGNDSIAGGAGADTMTGGVGLDTLDYSSSATAVQIYLFNGFAGGDAAGDSYSGFENATGGGGNDFLAGDALANTLSGNFGNDTLQSGGGNDNLSGGDGNDNLSGGAGGDTMSGGTGIDTLDYSSSALALQIYLFNGFAGGDAAGDSYSGIENVTGGAGNDFLAGDALANVLSGNGGNDTLQSGDGNDTITGGTGSDSMAGGTGIDTLDYSSSLAAVQIYLFNGFAGGDAAGDSYSGIENVAGGSGNDFLAGDGLANALSGNAGNDTLQSGDGNDTIAGGAGSDSMAGGNGIDTLDYSSSSAAVQVYLFSGFAGGDAAGDSYTGIENVTGGAGNDFLAGDGLANVLSGNAGNDTLQSGDGIDTLAGGLGNDALTGGAGKDFFVFSTAIGAGNIDTIVDFTHGLDNIQLSATIFSAIGAALTVDEFRIGAAVDGNDFILYDSVTGALTYDTNGSGAGGATQFALLSAGLLTLSFDDFVLA